MIGEAGRATRVVLFGVIGFVACLLAACGGDDAVPDAGTVDGSTADAGLGVTPPAIPWLAEGVPPLAIAPCPMGWREVTEGGVTTCDPYPETGAATCSFGEAHFPGEAGCRPIGEPCPAGDYAEALPTDGSVRYVNALAAPGGDGSLALPYAALSEVNWFSLAPGTTVALARGTYVGTLPLRAGVRVVGACVAETRVTGTTAPVEAVVIVTSTGEPATVRNLAIADAPQGGVLVEDGQALSLEGVLVERASGAGMVASDPATTVTARDLVIRSTGPAGEDQGRGISIERSAHLDAARILVEHNHEIGLRVSGPGAEALLADAVVHDTQPRTDDRNGGLGIVVVSEARLEASRLLVSQSRDLGVLALGPGVAIVLADAVVRETSPRVNDGLSGRGINVEGGAHLEASRLLVAESAELGVMSVSAGTTTVLTDAVVRDARSDTSREEWGRGIGVESGARLEASRLVVERNLDIGVAGFGAGTEIVLTDALVRDTRPHPITGQRGRGIDILDGAHLEGTRLLLTQNRDAALVAELAGTSVALADVAVSDMRAREIDLSYGYGLAALAGARITGQRIDVDGTREVGLIAWADGSIELDDVSVANVERSECDCGRVFGYAVVAYGGAVRLGRFQVRRAANCGLFVGADPRVPGEPSLDVASGVVEQAAIGACLQVEGYDVMRLTRDVSYRDNGANLDSTSLPVPEAPDPVTP